MASVLIASMRVQTFVCARARVCVDDCPASAASVVDALPATPLHDVRPTKACRVAIVRRRQSVVEQALHMPKKRSCALKRLCPVCAVAHE